VTAFTPTFFHQRTFYETLGPLNLGAPVSHGVKKSHLPHILHPVYFHNTD